MTEENCKQTVKEVRTEVYFLLLGVVLEVDEVNDIWMFEVSEDFQLLKIPIRSPSTILLLYFFDIGVSIGYSPQPLFFDDFDSGSLERFCMKDLFNLGIAPFAQ